MGHGEVDLQFLQVLAEGGDHGTDRSAQSRETETREKTSDVGSELDEQVRAVVSDNGQEMLNGLAEVLQEITNAASGLDNLTDGGTDTGETKVGEKLGDGRAELDEQALGVGASDLQNILNLRGGVLDNAISGALDVLAESGNDGTNGDAETGEAKAGEEASDLRRELDEESTGILGDNGQEALDLGAEVLQKVADAAGSLNDFTDGGTNTGETKAGQETGNLGAELDEELLSTRSGDGQDLIDTLADVLDKVAVSASRGRRGGRGGRGARGTLGDGLGDVSDTRETSRGSDGRGGRGGQSSEEGDERCLHYDGVGFGKEIGPKKERWLKSDIRWD